MISREIQYWYSNTDIFIWFMAEVLAAQAVQATPVWASQLHQASRGVKVGARSTEVAERKPGSWLTQTGNYQQVLGETWWNLIVAASWLKHYLQVVKLIIQYNSWTSWHYFFIQSHSSFCPIHPIVKSDIQTRERFPYLFTGATELCPEPLVFSLFTCSATVKGLGWGRGTPIVTWGPMSTSTAVKGALVEVAAAFRAPETGHCVLYFAVNQSWQI